MSVSKSILIAFVALFGLSFSSIAELRDQGLSSVMQIIDKAIEELNQSSEARADETEEELEARQKNAQATILNLSKTLGTLSYSRLQCGEAEVLAEFTQRVQLLAEDARDPMRDAFQEGFDKSQKEATLLSEDECERLTESRNRDDKAQVANVVSEKKSEKPTVAKAVEEEAEEDPIASLLRVAELTGQLAYKRKFCEDEKVFTRDFNEYINSVPKEYRAEVKTAYWKGYTHGKRLNRNLTKSQCS